MRDRWIYDSVNLAGKTDLQTMAALFERAECVISSDSGPLHVANAVGTDVVAIFGPTDEKITGPRGIGRSLVIKKDVGCNREACYHLKCLDNICMKAVTVKDVLDGYRQIKS